MPKSTTFIAGLLTAAVSFTTYCIPHQASAEMYVAGEAGVNFADRINSIAGTGPLAGAPGFLRTLTSKTRLSMAAKLDISPGTVGMGSKPKRFTQTLT